jgi:galactokinase/mevalonate kinase-like predicted kinase
MAPPRRVVVSAPARAGVLGNPTDQYGGSQISCSVRLRAQVRLVEAPRLVLATSGQECRIETPHELERRGDQFDLARAVLAELGPLSPACRIEWTSEIPLQGGLAGSTALLVALLQACLAWQRRPTRPHALAELARHIESTRMGVVCGFGDQYMAVFGGLRYLDFRGKAHGEVSHPPRYATVEALDGLVPFLPFALGVTGVRHSSGSVHKPIRERWLAGDPEVVAGYARMGELAREGKVALLTDDLPRFGELMNENHALQRGFGGSGESNEVLIAAALRAGALGAKLAGAGDGGTIIALWPEADVTPLELALRAAGAVETPKVTPVPGVRVEEDSVASAATLRAEA